MPKYAVPEGVISPLGIEGDSHAHPQIHGGVRQAILIITSEAIEELVAKGYPVYPGALGENLTTIGLDHRQLRIGQQLRAGEALLEITKIRVPCDTVEVYGEGIGRHMYDAQVKAGDATSPRWGISGFYASVLRPGTVRVHDIIDVVATFA